MNIMKLVSELLIDTCFVIKFNGPLEWELYQGNQFILSSTNFNISLRIQNPIDEIEFTNEFNSNFINSNLDVKSNVKNVWGIVQATAQQSKDTLLVISTKAQEESIRLKDVGFKVQRFKLDDKIIKAVSSIDGAILIDPTGSCYALGVILDGMESSSTKSDSSRGARYNSAQRYKQAVINRIYPDGQSKFMIVVISEDGMIGCV